VRIQRFPRPSGNIVGKRRRNIPASTDLQLGWFITEEIAVADVNGDGKPDVLLSNYCADSSCQSNGVISVLLGDGKGGFAPPQNYSSGGNLAEALALADFNGDGKLDVVVYSPCAPGVGRGTCEAGQVNGVMGVLLGKRRRYFPGCFDCGVKFEWFAYGCGLQWFHCEQLWISGRRMFLYTMTEVVARRKRLCRERGLSRRAASHSFIGFNSVPRRAHSTFEQDSQDLKGLPRKPQPHPVFAQFSRLKI
jgi:hypothetical protein